MSDVPFSKDHILGQSAFGRLLFFCGVAGVGVSIGRTVTTGPPVAGDQDRRRIWVGWWSSFTGQYRAATKTMVLHRLG